MITKKRAYVLTKSFLIVYYYNKWSCGLIIIHMGVGESVSLLFDVYIEMRMKGFVCLEMRKLVVSLIGLSLILTHPLGVLW